MREKILAIIEKNSRIDLKDLAALLGESEAAVANEIAERIYQYSEVTSVYLMSGAFDFTVIIEGKTMREVAQFVSEKLSPMDSVLSTATHFVLKKYKDHGTVMCGKAEDERMMITP